MNISFANGLKLPGHISNSRASKRSNNAEESKRVLSAVSRGGTLSSQRMRNVEAFKLYRFPFVYFPEAGQKQLWHFDCD